VFRRRRFLDGAEASEVGWFTPAGTAMTAADWADRNALALAVYLDGRDDPDRDRDGSPMLDDDFLILVNAWWEPLTFTIPATRATGQSWRQELDTYEPATAAKAPAVRAGDRLSVGPRSIMVCRAPASQNH
jgi:isoamylase